MTNRTTTAACIAFFLDSLARSQGAFSLFRARPQRTALWEAESGRRFTGRRLSGRGFFSGNGHGHLAPTRPGHEPRRKGRGPRIDPGNVRVCESTDCRRAGTIAAREQFSGILPPPSSFPLPEPVAIIRGFLRYRTQHAQAKNP